jgi:hypothetical protein
VFLNSPYRETPKNVLKKKSEKKKVGGWLVPRKLIKYTSRSVHFFLSAPRNTHSTSKRKKAEVVYISMRRQAVCAARVGAVLPQRSSKAITSPPGLKPGDTTDCLLPGSPRSSFLNTGRAEGRVPSRPCCKYGLAEVRGLASSCRAVAVPVPLKARTSVGVLGASLKCASLVSCALLCTPAWSL